MDFMKLLKSVEELLYELVSWIIFYPLTLWRCIRHPLRMMKYAEAEMVDTDEGRYDDALSPPIFLLITLFCAHLLELRFGVKSATKLPGILQDETNLLLYRAVAFSLFPLLLALQDVRLRGALLTRKVLRPSFYSQSYIAAPFVLALDLGLLIGQHGSPSALATGTILLFLGLTWYCGAEIAWFRHMRSLSVMKAVTVGVGTVLFGFVALLAVLVATALSAITW